MTFRLGGTRLRAQAEGPARVVQVEADELPCGQHREGEAHQHRTAPADVPAHTPTARIGGTRTVGRHRGRAVMGSGTDYSGVSEVMKGTQMALLIFAYRFTRWSRVSPV